MKNFAQPLAKTGKIRKIMVFLGLILVLSALTACGNKKPPVPPDTMLSTGLIG